MEPLTESLQELIEHDKRLIDKLEPRLKEAKERLRLSEKLYSSITGIELIGQHKPRDQSKMPLFKGQETSSEKPKRLTIAKATKLMLEEKGKPLHAKEILAKLSEYGSSASTMSAVWVSLSRNSKLFKNIGKNRWVLRKDAPSS